MKRVIAMLILINLMHVSATTLAQQTREAAPVVQPGVSQDGDTHVVSYGETLGGIADSYGIDLNALMRINGLYSHVIFPGRVLQLPTTATSNGETIAIPRPEAPPDKHIVQHGETLGKIAAAYGIDLNALIIENGIFGHIIYPGQVLILPGATAEASHPPPASDPIAIPIEQPIIPSQVTYVVRPGDTLSELAQAYGITLLTLMRANDIYYPHRIFVGQQLQVPSTSSLSLTVANVEPFIDLSAPATADSATVTDASSHESAATEEEDDAPDEAEAEPPAISEPPPDHFEHTVQFRETLSVIAKHYGIPMDELMRTNGIADANRINQGQTLWIPPAAITREPPPAPVAAVAPVAVAATEAAPSVNPPGDREQYTVRRGDSLSMIGKRLATDWLVMAQINGLAAPYNLHAGMVLLVPNSDDLVRLGSTHARTRLTTVPPPGAHVGLGREFVVVLSTQMAYAYEDGILKKSALIASGLPATPTVRGNFKIYRKVRKQRMSGPGYSLPNVEWVMYFYRGYAFHGTWWHTNFGQPQSKGCINMTNADAMWFYNFGSIGTPVHVRY